MTYNLNKAYNEGTFLLTLTLLPINIYKLS